MNSAPLKHAFPHITASGGRAWRVRDLRAGLDSMTLERIAPQPPGPGAVQVAMKAVCLNFPDLLMMRGAYQRRPALPFTPGMEGAGVVAAVGPGVAGVEVGASVIVQPQIGALCETLTTPAETVRPLPDGLDFTAGAALSVGHMTAWVALIVRGNLRAGETVLIHGASGGVGLAAVQIAARFGAQVIATGAAANKLAVCAAHGAHHTLDITETPRFRDVVKAATKGQGADVVYDPVGGNLFDESVHCIAWGGRLLSIGFTSGRIPALPVNLALIKGFSLIGVRAGEMGRRDPALRARALCVVDGLARDGVRPVIGATFPFAETPAAFRALQSRAHAGRIVVTL